MQCLVLRFGPEPEGNEVLPESGDEGWQEDVASNHGRKPAALQHSEACHKQRWPEGHQHVDVVDAAVHVKQLKQALA